MNAFFFPKKTLRSWITPLKVIRQMRDFFTLGNSPLTRQTARLVGNCPPPSARNSILNGGPALLTELKRRSITGTAEATQRVVVAARCFLSASQRLHARLVCPFAIFHSAGHSPPRPLCPPGPGSTCHSQNIHFLPVGSASIHPTGGFKLCGSGVELTDGHGERIEIVLRHCNNT